MANLNVHQRLFINHLVNAAKDDPVKAAKLAGYSRPESAAVSLMKNPTIAAEMERRLEESGAMPVVEVLARLSTIASLDVMEFVDFRTETKKDGTEVEKAFLDLKRIKKLRKGNLIKDLKIRPSGEIEVNFHNAVEAMDKLAKYHGMFKERIEIEHLNGDAASERISLLVSIIAQQPRAIAAREGVGETEPGELCVPCEPRQVEVVPAPEAGESTPAVGEFEGG